MRCIFWLAAVVLVAGVAPARAQFEDLIRQTERLQIDREVPVTLSLQRVSVQDAVKKLAEMTGLDLRCAPPLAERKVSIVCRERPVREIGEGLARAVQGSWRRDVRTFILEPISTLEVLTPAELASEARVAFLQPGAPSGYAQSQMGRQVLGSLAPQQMAALQSGQGLTFDQLNPRQRQLVGWMLSSQVASSLRSLPQEMGRMQSFAGANVSIQRRGNGETLTLRTQNSSFGFSLSTGR